MMNKIKHALGFVLGALYCSSIWFLNLYPEDIFLKAVFYLIAVLGSVLIIIETISFLIDYWE